MRKSFWLFLLVITFGFLQSCDQGFIDTPEETLVAPQVPPAELYLLPMANFEEVEKDGLLSHNSKSRSNPKKNWVHAGINLLVWHSATVLNSVIPLAAFGEALKQKPTLINEKQFLWTYDYTDPIKGDIYAIKLTAVYINNRQNVEWIMTTSKIGGFSDFEWYSAVIATDFTTANFTVNHQPENVEPYLSIDVERDLSGENASIRYTNIRPNNERNGQYIEYRATTEGQYNRAFDVQGGENFFLQIQWDEATKVGQVKHPSHFQDELWHCWDENFADKTCEG